ncbi:hypothetical protein [Niallia sp. 03190]|uniref:hypothetical protein n=1 Tax=Niallia sp. 03190 TaxID=3458061 RepID=UPI004043F4B6
MRTVNLNIDITRVMSETKSVVEEDILIKNDSKSQKYLYVQTVYRDANRTPIKYNDISITGSYYDLLMSQTPDFAPNKPLNEYREVDLWYIIDLIRAEQSSIN